MEGRACSHWWNHPHRFAVRLLWKIPTCWSSTFLRACDCRCHRNEVGTKEACVVLDHHDRHRGSSCPIDFVRSLDGQMGACHRDYPYPYRGFVRNARDSFCCREIGGKAEDLGKMSFPDEV